MAGHSTVLETIREAGHRLTPQRVMILGIIAEQKGHIAADELFDRVRQLYPYIDATTVYRTLQFLKRHHLVTEIEAGGTTRYELVVAGGHHHMVCRECGKTFDFGPSYLKKFRETLRRDFGFDPDLEHFAIGGLCADCSRKHTND